MLATLIEWDETSGEARVTREVELTRGDDAKLKVELLQREINLRGDDPDEEDLDDEDIEDCCWQITQITHTKGATLVEHHSDWDQIGTTTIIWQD